jgi:hypothetical protein
MSFLYFLGKSVDDIWHLSQLYEPFMCSFIKTAGGGMCMFVSGAFPQNRGFGFDFEHSF